MYKLEISNEAWRKWGNNGVWFSLCIRSLEFVTLKALGRGGARWPTFFLNSWASLYARALRQFISGRTGWSCSCSFIRPLIVGADGFILMYFHLVS